MTSNTRSIIFARTRRRRYCEMNAVTTTRVSHGLTGAPSLN